MIKLFWNTHNQKSTDTIEANDNKDAVDSKWGIYHKNNSDKWIYFILEKIKFKIIESEKELESGDVLVVIDSSIEKKDKLYKRLKLICSKMFLIHLGDEAGSFNLNSIYDNFHFVWRTFCSNKYFTNKHVKCLAIGYKSGTFYKKQEDGRKYKWAFIGTPHKSSRHDLLFQFFDLKPFFCHKTKKFDEKIISVDEMSNVFSSTEFVPCPNGFFHPETYRLYEALECGCVPIVENAYKYYERLFPNNPFIKVDKWIEAKSVIKNWEDDQIKKKQKECKTWWDGYKINLQELIKNKITQ